MLKSINKFFDKLTEKLDSLYEYCWPTNILKNQTNFFANKYGYTTRQIKVSFILIYANILLFLFTLSFSYLVFAFVWWLLITVPEHHTLSFLKQEMVFIYSLTQEFKENPKKVIDTINGTESKIIN